jgi:sec-independent protein translocase protein TatA
MIANIFGPDLGYVVIIVLVVMIGGSQLPKIARNVGSAGREFRKAQAEAEEEAQREEAQREEAQREQAQAQPAVPPASVGPAPSAVPAPHAVSAVGGTSADDQPSLRMSPAQLEAFLKAHEDEWRRGAAG